MRQTSKVGNTKYDQQQSTQPTRKNVRTEAVTSKVRSKGQRVTGCGRGSGFQAM